LAVGKTAKPFLFSAKSTSCIAHFAKQLFNKTLTNSCFRHFSYFCTKPPQNRKKHPLQAPEIIAKSAFAEVFLKSTQLISAISDKYMKLTNIYKNLIKMLAEFV
jgi:hypothetical protein